MARIKELIHENSCITVQKLDNELEISFGKCQSILTVDLNVEECCKICASAAECMQKQNYIIVGHVGKTSENHSFFVRFRAGNNITGLLVWPEDKVTGCSVERFVTFLPK